MAALAAIFLLLAWTSIGYRVCRSFLGEHRLLILLPAGMVLGPTLAAALVNGAGRFLPIAAATALVTVSLLLLSVLLRRPTPAPVAIGGPPLATLLTWLAAVSLAIAAAVTFGANPDLLNDRHFHGPLVATIAAGTFPPEYPGLPGERLAHHYGGDLSAAMLAAASGLLPWQAELATIVFSLITTWLLAYGVGSVLGRSPWSGWGTALAMFFVGSWAVLGSFPALGLYHLLPQTTGAYATQVAHLPSAVATPLILLSLYLFWHLSQTIRPLAPSLLLGFTLGYLGLVAEDRAILLLAALGLVAASAALGIESLRPLRQQWLARFLPALVVATALLAIQGGVVTSTLRQWRSETRPWVATVRLAPPTLPAWSDRAPFGVALPLTDHRLPRFALREFGLGVLSLGGILWLHRRRHLEGATWLWLLTAAGVSLLLPAFLQFPAADVNRTRLYATFRDFSNLALGVLIGTGAAKGIHRSSPWLTLSLLVAGAWYSSGAVLYLGHQLQLSTQRLAAGQLPTWLTPAEQAAANIGRTLPSNAIILTNQPTTVGRLWGRRTAHLDPILRQTYDTTNPYHPAYAAMLQQPTPEGLQQLGITHVYLAPPDAATPIPPFRQPMATGLYERDGHFTLLYRSQDPDGERRIYAFTPPDR